MRSGDSRWVEVSPSAFAHEQDGLDQIRRVMPDESPFRAWSNVEFRDSRGGWHEVDLLLLGRDALYLVELKYYAGTVTGDDHTWRRNGRSEDSPLRLARRKAQRLASRLKDELRERARERGVAVDERAIVPFVQEVVFLHHPQGRCELPASSKVDLYGPDGNEATSLLPGISELFDRDNRRALIGENQEAILVALLARIGLVQRRDQQVGSWIVEADVLDSGEDWQDRRAYHHVTQQEQARIRFQAIDPMAPAEVAREQRRIAEHEFRLMSRLAHDGLLRPRDLVDSELGIGLVYPYDEQAQRLDLWMASNGRALGIAGRLDIVRQVAEAMHYAHGNAVVHRALNPRSVWVRPRGPRLADGVSVQIGDWQAAGSTVPAAGSRLAGVTSLHRLEPAATPTSATTAPGGAASTAGERERALTEAFLAPEGVWTPTADRVRLDVFALGALTAYLLTGTPAAATATGLKERLKNQRGIDLALDLPQISSEARTLVLRSTDPAPSRRLSDVGAFLALLAKAQRASLEPDESADPLTAAPGARIDSRFTLVQRLGQGSTAAGLLVHDDLHGVERVLKVALNQDAATRLEDEAKVLARLNHPRIVRLVEGPITVAGRPALVLESAGTQTLADELSQRTRLSLDRLDRYGTDLLEALVALDRAGVDHRDIKPSNLGVRENPGDHQKHLVLFDFSLTGAAASSTSAGTPPYLDPFFDEQRPTYDSAAERYAAAVVLFEMATGHTPVYGDAAADPAAVPDDATVTRSMFDPSLAQRLAAFFTKALARTPDRRHRTAEEMMTAWQRIFTRDATTQPDADHEALAAAATRDTPLVRSGLTARALSALEPLAVATVGELLAVDPVALARLKGVSDITRKQILQRVKDWKNRLGEGPAPRGPGARSLTDVADTLLTAVPARSRNDHSRRGILRLVLGVDSDLDAFATQAELAAYLQPSVTPARAGQILTELQGLWARRRGTSVLLDHLVQIIAERLTELGGVATPNELAAALTTALGDPDDVDLRRARGLVRLAIERARALTRADEDAPALELRRRAGIVTLIATDPALFDVAEALGAEAARLVDRIGDPTTEVVPAARALERLHAALPDHLTSGAPLPDALGDPRRLVALATGLAPTAYASGTGELHTLALTPAAAVARTLAGFGGAQAITPREVRDRVAARYPALAALPERPALDTVIDDADLALVFDDALRAYRPREVGGMTTGLETRRPTTHELASAPVSDVGPFGVRLSDSIRSRSFVALGVRPQRLLEAVEALRVAFDAEVVDLTALLIDALHQQTAGGRPSWSAVRAADAAAPGSRARRGLDELVRRAWPSIAEHLESLVAQGGSRPVVITDASPLARYGRMDLLARWTDLAAGRDRAVWLLAPQPPGNHGPLLDGAPIPLAAPGQFVALDPDWIDTTLTAPTSNPMTTTTTTKEP